ncbi:hypothetical protein ACFFRR_010750 [Megaselia abdita]
MVDPNRKINRLSETDISFLDICEEKFENRFTDSDEQFTEHCKRPTLEPPVIPEFEQRHYNHGGGYNRNNRYNRPNRGGGGGYNNHRNHPYQKRGGGFNRGRGGGSQEHNFNYRYQ